MAKELKIVQWEELPQPIVDKVCEAQTQDILDRFDNSTYHNQDIIHNVLAEFGYKLID